MHVEASDEGITKEISDFFTFEVPGASFMPSYRNRHWDGKIRLYNLSRRELYVGLLPYLLEFAKQLEYEVKLEMGEIGEDMSREVCLNLQEIKTS